LVLIAIGLVVGASAIGAERIRAHCELDVQEGTDLKRVEMSSDVTPGVPIKYDLGAYTLLLSIDIGESETYVLTVFLAPLQSPDEALVKRSFNGRLVGANVGPLEFEIEQSGLKVSGAIAVSSLPR
jgi:hypothetical protein